MKRLKCAGLAAIAFVVCIYSGTSYSDSTPVTLTPEMQKNLDAAFQQGITPFTLSENSTTTPLKVPVAYLDQNMSRANGRENYLHLRMQMSLAPSSERARLSTQEYYDEQDALAKSGKLFHIALMQGTLENQAGFISKNIQKGEWLPFSGVKNVPGFGQYISFLEKKMFEKTPRLAQRILIPSNSNSNQPAYLVCPVNPPEPTIGYYCEGHIYLDHFVYAEYQFSYADLENWKQTDAAVRAVFEKMRQ